MAPSDTHAAPPTDLSTLVEAWSQSAQAVIDLVGSLREPQMDAPTDLPGWTVRDIIAHLAHLESELAGEQPELAPLDAVPESARGNAFQAYTERGVAARRDRSTEALVTELTDAVARLRETLSTTPPPDPPASFPRPGRDWEPLLRDRCLDFWMHEQDIRRAIDQPGGWDSPGAWLTLSVFRAALPFVVGKRVRPAPGTVVSWVVQTPSGEQTTTVRMGEDGRARPDETSGSPDVSLTMTVHDFVLACGGRRRPQALTVRIDGDRNLGEAVLDAMAVTP